MISHNTNMDDEGFEEFLAAQIKEMRGTREVTKEVDRIFGGIETTIDCRYYQSAVYSDTAIISIWKNTSLDFTADEARELRRLLSERGIHGKWAREFDERTGQFSWKLSLENVQFGSVLLRHLLITIARSSTDGCTIVPVQEMVTRYKSTCEPVMEESE